MGIKFHCPNGHKLHVKSYLSGKRAICPKCGERVLVPTDPASILESDSVHQASADAGTDTGASVILQTAGGGDGPPAVAVATATGGAAAPQTPGDGLDEAPTAVWYVRPATGGQFGPASREIMKCWIAEGRVGASTLVWRPGWEEWRAASEIFPRLQAQMATPAVHAPAPSPARPEASPAGLIPAALPAAQPVAPSPVSSGGVEMSTTAAALAEGLRKKRRNKDLRLVSSAILLVLSIILVAVLFVVFRSRNDAGERAPDAAQPTSLDSTRPTAGIA